MPKGRTDDAKTGPGEYEHLGSSEGEVRTRFLIQIRLDAPYVLEALRALDGSEPTLLAWAADWHLQDEWILDVARRTLHDWRAHPTAFSPDGTRVAFLGVRGGLRQVYVRRLDQFDAVPLRGTETAQACFF